jgi:hypothetical protein
MKKLLITLSILLSFSTLTAQEAFNGMWGNDGSSYITTIIATEYKVMQVFNTSFEDHRILPEHISYQKNNKFTTELYNNLNGYSVTIEYSLKDKNTIILKYSKDLEEEYLLTRLY